MICRLCPKNCGADRPQTAGACGARELKIARADLHFFEEPPISGTRGSGTVFFCNCSLRCVFCQNAEVSRGRVGKSVSPAELADLFRRLEARGAHNINLVTPTHYLNEIEEAFSIYRPDIPVVWNTHAYENPETVERAARFTDIFLPDLKYFSPEISLRYAGVRDYFDRAFDAIRIMRRSKRDDFGGDGIMRSGVIVRHLILPMNVDETFAILGKLHDELPGTLLSLMSQYTPCGDPPFPELKRGITKREYARAVSRMRELGIPGFLQDLASSGTAYIPEWDLR